MAYIDGTRAATLTMSHTQNVQVRIWNPFATQPLEPIATSLLLAGFEHGRERIPML